MFSIFFTDKHMLKFRYEMKDLYSIQEDLKIDLRNFNDIRFTTEQLVKLTYIGLKNDVTYSEFIDIADGQFNTILNFALETLSKNLSYIEDEEYENDTSEEYEEDEDAESSKFIDIDKILSTAIKSEISIEDFWKMTPREVYTKIGVYKVVLKERSDFNTSLHYLNAYLQRTKRMPPLNRFVSKKKKKPMTDEQMFAMVERLHNRMTK